MFTLLIIKETEKIKDSYETINNMLKIYYIADKKIETKTNGFISYHNNTEF